MEHRILGTSNNSGQVQDDPQNTSSDDTLYRTISLAATALFGTALYKSGALRQIVKPALEVGEIIARQGLDKSYANLSTIKSWTKLTHESLGTVQARHLRYNAPEYSIFRLSDHNAISWATSLRDDVTSGSWTNLKRLINGTAQDVNLLKTMIQDASNEKPMQLGLSTNTDLYRHIKEMQDFNRTLGYYEDLGTAGAYKNKYFQELVSSQNVTLEMAKQAEKESGYRPLTLMDVFEKTNDPDNPFRLKQGVAFDGNSKDGYTSLLDEINDITHDPYLRRTFLNNDAWEHMKIDKSLRIDETGHIIDTRMTRKAMVDFIHSVSNDFGLPVVRFNPITVLLHPEKIDAHKPFGGYISPNQFMPSITRQGGMVRVGDYLAKEFGDEFVDSSLAIINGKAFLRNPKTNQMMEIAHDLELFDITHADKAFGLKPSINAERQMANLDIGHAVNIPWDDYAQRLQQNGITPTKSMEYRYKIARLLDMDFQEARMPDGTNNVFDFSEQSSIDEWINKGINKLTNKIRFTGFEYDSVQKMVEQSRVYNMKTVLGEGFANFSDRHQRIIKPKMFYAQTKGYSVTNILKAIKAQDNARTRESLRHFTGQFIAGRNTLTNEMGQYYTKWSTKPWIILNALSEGLGSASHLLGLSTSSKASSGALLKNLLLRRALPAYMLTQLPGMINYFSEPIFGKDENGNQDNVGKWMMRGVSKIDVGAHKVLDTFGATDLFKFMQEMIPGSEQINELPGIYQLGLGQTAEERKKYIKSGVDPIRKSRWWGAGNTPFTGGKILYFRPNIYRRVQADIQFSDSKWGSRQEYYENTWYPNLVNPLAPLNHFVLDRHHYDKKHYKDRPYLQYSTPGGNIPIIGPAIQTTIRGLVSPGKMHKEYWDNDVEKIAKNEEDSQLLITGDKHKRGFISNILNSKRNIDTIEYTYSRSAQSMQTQYTTSAQATYLAKQVISTNNINSNGLYLQQRTIQLANSQIRPANLSGNEVYITPSGQMNIVDIPSNLNLNEVNQSLRNYSLNQVQGVNQRVHLVNDFQGPGIPVGNQTPKIDNAFLYNLGETYNVLSDVAGLKGFTLQQFITGHPNEKARIIEDSGYAYSFNNSFWNQNLGGLGGNLSEITRRFVPERNKKTDYINPIRNTMPTWIPGSNYFTDFKHGDPYTKVMNGEERLPGEGYERLHGLNNLMDLPVNASILGFDKASIVKNLLHAGPSGDGNKGSGLHKAIQKRWRESGLAIDTNGEIIDERNNITAQYDALINDPSSLTGVAIADIKLTDAKQLRKIKFTQKPLEDHKRQVNYYLWATNNTNSKGYVHYVDKDNPNKSYTVGFEYSQKLLDDTLKDLYDARKTVRKAIASGEIGRGQLYDTFDRYRILADVAPYSQEFRDVKAQMANVKLSDEEHEEKQAIDKRIQQQKEPLRVYPYKFKTANLKHETVIVKKVLDNNTILVNRYGKDHAIKFAGINVSESNSELYKSWKETYTDKRGTQRTRTVGTSYNEAAKKEIRKYIRPGSIVNIGYDADERNKFSKDSTESIRAVITSHGVNVNRRLLNKGLAKEKENDDSPAAIHVRYTKGERAFGKAMESLTHSASKIPILGSKLFQVNSPYEQYRIREVYGKDFQTWNQPISSILVPSIEQNIANKDLGGFGGILAGAFIGSMFGASHSRFGRLMGGIVGGAIPAIGKIVVGATHHDKDREWRPQRRIKQEQLNEYVDTLKYIKNMRLYEQYKQKAKHEDHFDVDEYMQKHEGFGIANKLRVRELNDYKKKVKLDFKHHKDYNFKYGEPKYVSKKMKYKEVISGINKEIMEINSRRKVDKLPDNALKAIGYKQQAQKTMYGFEPGDSLVNIMTALPKKDRQYFKHFMDAPEEEKDKILRIAPSYMRRALQSAWGKPVDKKPSLDEYFMTHGLPNSNWVGWNENTNIDDIKVKLVHNNKLDPGEFDIWQDNKIQADQVNIPIPIMNATNTRADVHANLKQILGEAGYTDIQVQYVNNSENRTEFNIRQDERDAIAEQIANLDL